DLTAGSVWWGCFPNLVGFVAQFVAPATLIGIEGNCPQLEILDVSLAQKGSSAVAYVLTTCAKLKSFVGKRHMIDASHAVQGPGWVCRDIERLHIEELDLGGYILLPDQLENTMVGSFPSSHMMSEESEYHHPLLRNSLDLSLASGLHNLAGLKNPRRIGVEEVDLSVGQEELDWMKEHWRLEAWMGLRPFMDHNLEKSDVQLDDDGFYSTKNLRLLRMIKATWPSISTS
ncbi:hypothetical protein BGZ81_005140, partial [Podila clonocystis]